MSLQLLHGESVSAFYWGQGYGGPLETVLAAPFVWLLGTSYLALRLVPVTLSAVTALVVWRVGLRTTSRHGALLAAALAWCFPTSLMWKTIQFHIFYASGILLGMLVLLQAIRLTEKATGRRALVLGGLTGLGLWQSFQLVTIVPAILGWLFFRRRDLLRYAPLGALGAAVSLLPALISNLKHNWWSFKIVSAGHGMSYLDRLWQLFTNTLPLELDLRTPVTLQWFAWTPVGLAVYAVVLTSFVWLVRQSRPGRHLHRVEVLVVIAATFPFIYALSPMTALGNIARYVLVLTPPIALLVTAWIRTTRQAVITSLAALILLTTNGLRLLTAPKPGPTDAMSLPRSFASLDREIIRLGIRRVWATYWIAHRITYETGERVIAAEMRPSALRSAPNGALVPPPNDPSVYHRNGPYVSIVSHAAWPAYVFDKAYDPTNTPYSAFPASGYHTSHVGPFTIYFRRGDETRTPSG